MYINGFLSEHIIDEHSKVMESMLVVTWSHIMALSETCTALCGVSVLRSWTIIIS